MPSSRYHHPLTPIQLPLFSRPLFASPNAHRSPPPTPTLPPSSRTCLSDTAQNDKDISHSYCEGPSTRKMCRAHKKSRSKEGFCPPQSPARGTTEPTEITKTDVMTLDELGTTLVENLVWSVIAFPHSSCTQSRY